MKWVIYHNGKELPYWLGQLINLYQFANGVIPGAVLDHAISHRIGVKRLRRAVKLKRITWADVIGADGNIRPAETFVWRVKKALYATKLQFWRHPLAAAIDWGLERIDQGHCIDSIGS